MSVGLLGDAATVGKSKEGWRSLGEAYKFGGGVEVEDLVREARTGCAK